jgi:hypothetical protein
MWSRWGGRRRRSGANRSLPARRNRGSPVLRPSRRRVADGGEAGVERLAGVGEGAKGLLRRIFADLLDQSGHPAGIRFEMDVAVDQAGEDETGGKVDQCGSGGRRSEAVLHGDDPAALDDDGRGSPRRPAGTVEQPAGMDDGHRAGGNGGRLGRLGRCDGGSGGGCGEEERGESGKAHVGPLFVELNLFQHAVRCRFRCSKSDPDTRSG